MKSVAAIEAAIVLLLVASAASCEVAKEYSTRVFKPASPQKKSDSTETALKFMQFDNGDASDSVDIKEFFAKDKTENESTELMKDTIRNESLVIENKNVRKETPVDATKRSTTRSKRVRQ